MALEELRLHRFYVLDTQADSFDCKLFKIH